MRGSRIPQAHLVAKPSSNILDIPRVGETFQLTLTKQQIDEFDSLWKAICTPDRWTYVGGIALPRTGMFKIAKASNYPWDTDEFFAHIAEQGKIPEGQWLLPLLCKYQGNLGLGAIGIARVMSVIPNQEESLVYVACRPSLLGALGYAENPHPLIFVFESHTFP